ncbi:hypothetical protein BCR43DRAFT_481879 [Syncephalastrum racemosum]|uniref:Uncharacterized protein n=1 Tax=Syncephalastrum racemosum TaxID=13706 RepID=A0A1X2HST4_SYNRA|nr:hypothetical protein BCR43DRAFT_481879 [Syncephalastrum racemosum]
MFRVDSKDVARAWMRIDMLCAPLALFSSSIAPDVPHEPFVVILFTLLCIFPEI